MNSKHKSVYSISLLLSIEKKLTCEAIAKKANKSGETFRNMLKNPPISVQNICEIAKNLFLNEILYLIIDDTLASKEFSQFISGSYDHYDSSNGRCVRSICTVVAMITDGKNAVPIDHKIYQTFQDKSQNKKKTDLAKELIQEISKYIKIDILICDGLYATKDFKSWLCKENIKYEMRFHANRVDDFGIPIKEKVALRGKWKRRTVQIIWKNMTLYVTCLKRPNKKGFSIVYLVSNFKSRAKNHEKIYSYRWNIEKFFRTTKQSLGLNDCQCRSIKKQSNHILNSFLAYTIALFYKIKYKLASIEAAIKAIRSNSSKFLKLNYPFMIGSFS